MKWGFLSTARVNQKLLPLMVPTGNEAYAVASRDAARAEAYAGEHGIPRSYGSYEELLADPAVEAVYIGLPNALHARWVCAAAEAGKHVLCEKPLALTAAEVESIMAAASARSVVVMEGFMYRHHPQTVLLKKLIDEGVVGRSLLFRSSFHFTLSNPQDVRLDPALGGGALGDLGCYVVSLMQFLAGDGPDAVQAHARYHARGVDEAMFAQLRFPGGAMGQFDISFTGPRGARLEILGTAGRLEVPTPFKPGAREELRLVKESGTEIIAVESAKDQFTLELEHFGAVVEGREKPRIPLAESLASARTLERLRAAAEAARAKSL